MSATDHATETIAWHAMSPNDVASRLVVDPGRGLDADEVERRLAQYGPNELRPSRRRACGPSPVGSSRTR